MYVNYEVRIDIKEEDNWNFLRQNYVSNYVFCTFRLFICYNSSLYQIRNGAVAQLGERLNGIQKVAGSTPVSSTAVFKYKIYCLGGIIK